MLMNEMLARLEAASVRQRQFVGDASHELRSPLTAVRAQVEVLRAHPDPSATAEVLRHVQDEADRMSQLIDDLLFLAAVTEGHRPTYPVDLDEIVLAEAARARTQDRVAVSLRGPAAARVQGVDRDLGRLLRNLLDNALVHARSAVTISLTTHGGEAVLQVADDGPGIPPQHRETVFARLARTDAARSRTSPGAGAGLGLAIAREIARAHGGTLSLSDPPRGPSSGPPRSSGAVFVLRLPLLADPAPH